MKDVVPANETSNVTLASVAGAYEVTEAKGVYKAECWEVLPEMVGAAERVLKKLLAAKVAPRWMFWRKLAIASLQKAFDAFPRQLAWTETYPNLVTTVGRNDLLDKYLAGSGYTATHYMGLISSTNYSGVAAGDTAVSHAGWLEAASAAAPNYSQSARPTCAWSAATGGSKSLSTPLTFTFTASGTVKGSFLSTVATKDSGTGTLFSAGLFTGGDQPVVSTNVVTVTYTLTV